MNYDPLVSIIIATYNCGTTIENTILSLINQNYKNIEIIIIDGGSDDSTITSIEKYSKNISYFVSEKDTGIYDAWNKGLNKAKGDWISFLGAGDTYLPDGIRRYIEFISKSKTLFDFVSSIIQVVDHKGNVIRNHGRMWSWPKFLSTMTCAHVGAFHSRHLFDTIGLFDTSFRIAGDYELLMRAGKDLKAGFIPEITARMISGGISYNVAILKEDRRLKIESGKKNIVLANIEYIINFSKFIIKRKLIGTFSKHR